jgi:hypothetical protein
MALEALLLLAVRVAQAILLTSGLLLIWKPLVVEVFAAATAVDSAVATAEAVAAGNQRLRITQENPGAIRGFLFWKIIAVRKHFLSTHRHARMHICSA